MNKKIIVLIVLFIAVIGLTMGSVSAKTTTKKSKKKTFTVTLKLKPNKYSWKNVGKYTVVVHKEYDYDGYHISTSLYKNKRGLSKYKIKEWIHLKSKNKWKYYFTYNYGKYNVPYTDEQYAQMNADADKIKIKTTV